MAQFGGQKNPPWAAQFAATAVSQPALGVQQPSLLGASPMYTQQSALASLNTQSAANYQLSQQTAALQQQAAAAAAAPPQAPPQHPPPQQTLYNVPHQPPVALPTSLSLSNPQQTAQITVSYPTPRSSHQQQTQPQKQRVFTGVVSKLHDTFGFVDEDVFFQLSAVKGKTPQVGDRVLVEAVYNPNMPFKWNAQRIQTLPQLPNQTHQPPQPLPQVSPQLSSFYSEAGMQHSVFSGGLLQPPVRMMPQPQQVRRVDPSPRFPSRSDRPELILRKDDRSRERDRERRRSRERSPTRKRSRDRSPRRERSPRRPRRVVPRYTVQFSKFSLDSYNCDVMELRRRYQSLYIPSDFFDAVFTWVDAFPLTRPFTFGNYCNFHIMHKEVDSLVKNTAVLDPHDANHTYSAKVMLLANPSLDELYHKSCALAEDPQELRDSFQHPARLIKFLVGMRGKDEAMAIGGHWSPSLDGADPENDASVLIKTAIRCCKALTGIDLSLCTQWYRFAEIRYHRPEETHKGRTVPAHVETVVLFLPDVWHCLPTRSEWEGLSRGLKEQLAEKLMAERKEADGEQEEEDKDEDDSKEVTTPTHWAKLDPKSMKVNDLRKELESRTLSSKGLKSQLIARLTKQLKVEEQVEESKEPEKPEPPSVEEDESCRPEDDREEEERKRQEEQERQRRERRYVLPDEPTIIVHPNWAAKNGKFDCSIMSLSVLLDYRLEDNKEHSFEVSLFAELFNEMLQRDFGYRIYKAFTCLPSKDERKDKKVKAKKEADRRDVKKEKDEENGEPATKRMREEDEKRKERGIKREESKDDDDNEDGSSNNNADEYDPLEAEDADDYDDDGRDSNGRDRRDDRRDERKSKERSSKDKDEKKKQMVTLNKDLLMAFVYFDQSHSGYLLEKDLEEIMYTLGLHLSRAQVKKLLNKPLVRESCHYRKLTDRPKDEPSPILTSDALIDNFLGNQSLLPSLKIKREAEDSGESSSLIVYKGSMVDVESMMQKLEKSEKAREEIEQKLMQQDIKMEEDSKHVKELEAANRSLQMELEEVKNNLSETENNLRASDQKKGSYEQQLHGTVSSLDTIMKEIQGVLSQGDPSDDSDQKTQANGSDE
uniref:Cell division cycle and apoptosis regulator protein 1 n=1 Tax=Cyprinus carpio TaxID=7962 RepID=A0A8C2Q406_CYPCA